MSVRGGRVYGEHGVRTLDDLADAGWGRGGNNGNFVWADDGGRYASGAPISSNFSVTGGGSGAGGGGDHHGHFRQSVPSLSQASGRSLGAASLEGLAGFKQRDLFASHAVRVALQRADVVRQTESELYVPRQTRLLHQDDFVDFQAAAAAYATTQANTTAHARAKAAARALKLGGSAGATAAGAGGGAAALVAAATSAAVAAADPTLQRDVPLIPQSHDPAELARAQATDAYLQEVWADNRARQAADERLRKHISSLVGEWAGKLARFEEEVARRQEDTYYAKFRRREHSKLAQSLPHLPHANHDGHHHHHPEEKEACAAAAKAALVHEDPRAHHVGTAYSTSLVGKSLHEDVWSSGTDLTLVDPRAKAAANRAIKEAQKRNKNQMDHRMASSVAASTLAAPAGPSDLARVLGQTVTSNLNVEGGAAESTMPLSFSSFRPVSSPAQRMAKAGNSDADASAGASPRPGTTGGGGAGALGKLLPSLTHLHATPPGLSVRQTRPRPFEGVPGHGNPLPTPERAHVFSSRSLAQAAGIGNASSNGFGVSPPPAHLQRRQELLDVERVQARLAETHATVGIPRGTLERALVAPEVRPIAQRTEQQQIMDLSASGHLLPTPFFSLVANPFAGEKKGKKGKGGKGGKGKKSSKKK